MGDLFDVIAEGDEPFTQAMRIHFDNAKKLYDQKLLPMLEAGTRRHRAGCQRGQASRRRAPSASATTIGC